MLNQRKPHCRFVFVSAALLLLAVLAGIAGCQASPSATPTPAPPRVTMKIVTLPAPPAVTIKIATLTPTPAVVTPPQVTLEIMTPVPTSQPSSDAAFTYLHTLATGDIPHLLDSYATTADFDDGDTAWTYDNALVLLTFLARGTDDDLTAARTLADALVYAQTHDPDFDNGRHGLGDAGLGVFGAVRLRRVSDGTLLGTRRLPLYLPSCLTVRYWP